MKTEEYNDEREETGQDIYVGEHKKELIEDFISENLNEFNEFMKNEIVDEDRDFDYWKMQFCEENEDEFNDYCKRAFEETQAVEETNRSLWRR
jgi:hypothetical protein